MAPRDSDLGYALLALLHHGPSSGYELRKVFTATPLAHFSDSPGAIYPALRRLRSHKWIEPLPDEAPSGRRRQRLRPTPAGRRALRAWLSRPVTPQDLVGGIAPLLLRFAFMGGTLPPRKVAAFLEDLQAALRNELAGLQAFFRAQADSMTYTGRLAFRSGLMGAQGDLRWVEMALREIRASAPSKGKER